MNIIFFGTPDYAVPVLHKVHKEFQSKAGESPIVAVVTQRPKPAGRSQAMKYSPVDEWAHKRKIPIHFDPMEVVNHYSTIDLGILASYGQIVPQAVIDHFKFGILNVHPSLLPEFRGASPVQATIVSGKQPGVTIMKLDEKLDHGPIVSQFKDELLPEDTSGSLRERLFDRAAEVMVSLIPAYISGKINIQEQNHEQATFTKVIQREDAFIDPKQLQIALDGKVSDVGWDIPFMKDFTIHYSSTTIHRFIRAMQPWPQAWTTVKLNKNDLETKRLKLLKSHLEPIAENIPMTSDNESQTTDHIQSLILDEVQLEGKNPVSWQQFKDGYPDFSLN